MEQQDVAPRGMCHCCAAPRKQHGYAIKHNCGSPSRATGPGARYRAVATLLLVSAPRTVGAPGYLSCATGRSGSVAHWLLDQCGWRNPGCIDSRPLVPETPRRGTLRARLRARHGRRLAGCALLLTRLLTKRAPRSQHLVLEIAACLRLHHRARQSLHSVVCSPAGRLRHHGPGAGGHGVDQRSNLGSERHPCRDNLGAAFAGALLVAAAVSPHHCAWPVVGAVLRMAAARLRVGAPRIVFMDSVL